MHLNTAETIAAMICGTILLLAMLLVAGSAAIDRNVSKRNVKNAEKFTNQLKELIILDGGDKPSGRS